MEKRKRVQVMRRVARDLGIAQHNNHNNYGFNCLNNAFVCFKLKRWTLDTVVVVVVAVFAAVLCGGFCPC